MILTVKEIRHPHFLLNFRLIANPTFLQKISNPSHPLAPFCQFLETSPTFYKGEVPLWYDTRLYVKKKDTAEVIRNFGVSKGNVNINGNLKQ